MTDTPDLAAADRSLAATLLVAAQAASHQHPPDVTAILDAGGVRFRDALRESGIDPDHLDDAAWVAAVLAAIVQISDEASVALVSAAKSAADRFEAALERADAP